MEKKQAASGDYGLESGSTGTTLDDPRDEAASEAIETAGTTESSTSVLDSPALEVESEKYGTGKPKRVTITAQVKRDFRP